MVRVLLLLTFFAVAFAQDPNEDLAPNEDLGGLNEDMNEDLGPSEDLGLVGGFDPLGGLLGLGGDIGQPLEGESLTDLILADLYLGTLVEKLDDCFPEYYQTLSTRQRGVHTFLAPNNNAWQKAIEEREELMNCDEFRLTILRHTIPFEFLAEDSPTGSVDTLDDTASVTITRIGDDLRVTSENGDANVVVKNREANNGIMHVVDAVL